MKTTLEISDVLFRKIKATAAARGQSMKAFLTDALKEKLERPRGSKSPWEASFGALKHLKKETARVQGEIDDACRTIDPEDHL